MACINKKPGKLFIRQYRFNFIIFSGNSDYPYPALRRITFMVIDFTFKIRKDS